MLPLFLDLRFRKVVVFGGGEVGLRKAKFFFKEAEVVVVSKTFVKGFDDAGLELVKEDALANLDKWVAWAEFVIAATDDHQLNERIINAAMMQNRYCNSADGISSFMIPSTVERQNYTVAISTLGRSPGMSKYLRLKVDSLLPDEYSRMVGLQEELRLRAKEKVPEQRSRERYLWEVLEDEQVWELVRAGEMESARELAEERMVRFIGNDP